MKTFNIEVGGVYHDSKLGVREVVDMDGAPGCGDTKITYRILAAKVKQEYSHAEKALVSLIGGTSKCELASFAAWAKIAVPAGDKAVLLADLAVEKLRLPAGETAFMASVAKEFDDEFPIKAGATVSFAFNETRSARGIEKKGLATVDMAPPGAGGEITLTELGAAWVRVKRGAVAPAS
mgnify:CR=1 FL=1